MARSELEALVFSLDANISKMQKKLDAADGLVRKSAAKTQSTFDKLGANLGGQFTSAINGASSQVPIFGDALMSLGGPVALTAAAGIGAVAFALGKAREAMTWADDLQALADHIGVTAESLQALQFAAGETDVDVSALHEGLQNLNASLGAVKSGVGAAKIEKAFEALQITPDQLKGMNDASDLLPLLADRMGEVGSRAEQVQLARKLGIEALLPMLQDGATGLKSMTDRASELGLVLDNQTVGSLADLSRQAEVASQRIDTELKRAFVDLAPVIVTVTNKTADFIHALTSIPKTGPDASLWDKYRIAMERARLEEAGWRKGKFGADNRAFVNEQLAKGLGQGPPTGGSVTALWHQPAPTMHEGGTPPVPTVRPPSSSTGGVHSAKSRSVSDASDRMVLDAARDQLDAYRNFAQAMQRAQADTLAAQQDIATTAAERLTLAQAALTAEYDARRESNLQASLNGDLSEADAAALDAQDRQTEALRQAALLREGEADILRERLDAERTMADLSAGYLQIIAASADTAEERRKVEQQLLAMAQKQARDQLEADIATNPSRYPDPQAARDSLGRIERAQNTAFAKDHEGPLKRYFDDIKDMNTYLQTAASEGLADFNQGILETTRSGAKAGQILQRVAQDLLAKLAMSGLKQGEQALFSLLKIPGFATGTDSAPGGLALVGEKGPELLNLPRGSKVFTSNLTKQFLSGSAGGSGRSTTVNQTLHFHNQGAVLADGLVKEMKSFAVGIGVEAAKGGSDIAAYNQSRAARRQLK